MKNWSEDQDNQGLIPNSAGFAELSIAEQEEIIAKRAGFSQVEINRMSCHNFEKPLEESEESDVPYHHPCATTEALRRWQEGIPTPSPPFVDFPKSYLVLTRDGRRP